MSFKMVSFKTIVEQILELWINHLIFQILLSCRTQVWTYEKLSALNKLLGMFLAKFFMIT